MSLASTGAGGRGGQQASIVGDVILHGKKHLWGVSGQHYHRGMKAGENTLNALCARVVMRAITQKGGEEQSDEKKKSLYDGPFVMEKYVEYMTTPNSHNDTYAGKLSRLSLSLSLSHTHTHTHTLSLLHTHTHTHTYRLYENKETR